MSKNAKLNLIKLCVGAPSPADLERWIGLRRTQAEAAGIPYEQFHTTRQSPKRGDEILETGGSLYWVMGGMIQARQKILDFSPITDAEGISRCNIVLEPKLHLVEPRKKRPFQGWRYLKPEDAPRDLASSEATADLPLKMQKELAELGLL